MLYSCTHMSTVGVKGLTSSPGYFCKLLVIFLYDDFVIIIWNIIDDSRVVCYVETCRCCDVDIWGSSSARCQKLRVLSTYWRNIDVTMDRSWPSNTLQRTTQKVMKPVLHRVLYVWHSALCVCLPSVHVTNDVKNEVKTSSFQLSLSCQLWVIHTLRRVFWSFSQ